MGKRGPWSFFSHSTGKCPVSPALEGGIKGHNIKGKYLAGKPRPLGRGASLSGYIFKQINNTR
jgi:hypothetical protein